MFKKSSKMLGMLATMAAVSGVAPTGEAILRGLSDNEKPRPKDGARQYLFDRKSEILTGRVPLADIVFKCYALNEKNARRKLENWRKMHVNKEDTTKATKKF